MDTTTIPNRDIYNLKTRCPHLYAMRKARRETFLSCFDPDDFAQRVTYRLLHSNKTKPVVPLLDLAQLGASKSNQEISNIFQTVKSTERSSRPTMTGLAVALLKE